MWIKKIWYIYAIEYYSVIKKNEIMPLAATWMDWEVTIPSGASQRRRNIICHPLYVESKKYIQMNLLNRDRLTDFENKLTILGGRRREGRDSQGVSNEYIHTAIFKWITNKDPLYSIRNSIQCYLLAWMGGEFGGEWIHVYVWLRPFAVHLKLSQHC